MRETCLQQQLINCIGVYVAWLYEEYKAYKYTRVYCPNNLFYRATKIAFDYVGINKTWLYSNKDLLGYIAGHVKDS